MNISKETLQKIAAANQANPYADITPYETGVGMPIVHYSGFFAQPGECIIYAAPAQTFKDKNQVVGYTGKSAGASFRVAKGVTVRTGSSGGKPIRGTVRDHNYGDLIITNKRVVFIGKDDSFDFPIEKVSAVKILDRQSFVLQSGRTAKNVAMDSAIVAYAAGFISYVQKEVAAGVDVYQNHQVTLTPEQLAYCDTVRQECTKVRLPKKKTKNGCLWTVVKVLFALVILVAAIGIIGSIIGGNDDSPGGSQPSGAITNYTASELVALEGHPRIFDGYAEAQAFYNGIGDSRIAVTDITKKSSMEMALETVYSDEIVLYMTQHSTNEEYIGTIEINIFNADFAADMTVEGAADIAVSYLPIDFFEYYVSDASYVYENDGTKIYTYSCRLTDEGVEHHNSIAPQYSYYYYIKIVEYADGEHWKISTGYSAYGDKDKGWIEKYAEPWDAPFQNQ